MQRNLLNMDAMAPKEHLTVQTFLISWEISDLIVGNNQLLAERVKINKTEKEKPKARLTVYVFISTSDGDSLGIVFAL